MAYDFDYSDITKQPAKSKRHKPDPLEEMLRIAQGAAPAVGTAFGAVGGGLLGSIIPGAGTIAGAGTGAAVGNAVGQGVGGLAGYGADQMGEADAQEEDDRVANETERAARNEMVARLLMSR